MTISTIKSQSTASYQLDSNLKLRDIINTLPKEVFVKDARKAWFKLIINVLCVGIGYWGLIVSPWFLLPILWVFTGTALQGFFVIAHDCGHRSFSNRNWVNDLVGHVMTLPLMYPFHAWRILHNHHHKHTNKLKVDNTWDPFTTDLYDNSSFMMRWGYRRMRGRFWWIGSILHWGMLHFNWRQFEGKQRQQVRFSVLLVAITGAIVFPTLIITTGLWGFVKFWLLPWMVYHFWMSTFTMFHHTMPEIPFTPESTWNEAQAQLSGTVHCKYPWWVEFLCHDINVHVPHHVCSAIPWYNLRPAYESLKENWGEYIYPECEFSWSLVDKVADRCHLYDLENNYLSFKDHKARTN
ncbi:MAG: fatty acid desaturase [Xenococcaceae cyanobacterium MO_188.B29]|nr:fatty acid desaturase [Xenococcaceae cyanobacterium MO_188.B29]